VKSEMVACDNTICASKATVPHAKVHPDGWWYVAGPHPHGRLDFCSLGCMLIWGQHGSTEPIPVPSLTRSITQ
jgi:hypothetical protein